MPSLVQGYAGLLGWSICECNVIVEGTSDVAFITLADNLYFDRHQTRLLDNIAFLAAGLRDDGGVDGLNRRLNAVRQLADADRGPDGSLIYRFIGLYDNDHAGRRAVSNACYFDRRLRRCADLFLIHPIMPLASGLDHAALQRRFDSSNLDYKGLDWEIEDLVSERLLLEFEKNYPSAIVSNIEMGGRKHRDLTRTGKVQLREFVKKHAALEDLLEIVRLIRALRDYHRLPVGHLVC